MEKQKRSFRWFAVVLLGLVVISSVMAVPAAFCGENKEVPGALAAESPVRPLSLWDAAILGVVEGVTEYLPVSSTGHLLLAEHLLGLAHDPASKRVANAYAIVIQAGAILAVLGLYRSRIRQILLGLIGRDAAGQALLLNLVIAFLPAVVFGLLLEDVIKGRLFGIWPVTAAWLAGGIFILFLDKKMRPHELSGDGRIGLSIESFGWKQALGIGLMQCAALWPGVSRSLATIAGGLFVGAELTAAVEFSFLLGLMTLGATTMYEAYKNGHMIVASFGLTGPLLGFFCAFVSAWISVKWMVGFLQRRGLALFGWYRIVLALVVAVVLLSGLGLQS
ncbi:MAG: undecaprenyl-diphosphate phosphatase [Desulfocapsaceae bacterium]|nr:undecaprenyl-diphosphate phosphatase [Desulfocapsaceae bacterium]